MTKSTLFDSATWRKRALDVVAQVGERSSPTSTATVPDSIFDRSRMSLISVSRSLPDEWIVLANSTCLAVRLPSGFLRQLVGEDQQAVERRAQLVRHVGEELGLVLRGERELLGLLLERLARLLDLAGSCARPPGSGAASRRGLLLAAPRWSAAAPPAGSAAPAASDCDCLSRSSVRMLASIVLSTMPMISVSWSRKAWCVGLKRSNEASSSTALTCALEDDRQHDDVLRRRLAEAEEMRDVVGRHVGQQDLLLLERALADEALAELELACRSRSGRSSA